METIASQGKHPMTAGGTSNGGIHCLKISNSINSSVNVAFLNYAMSSCLGGAGSKLLHLPVLLLKCECLQLQLQTDMIRFMLGIHIDGVRQFEVVHSILTLHFLDRAGPLHREATVIRGLILQEFVAHHWGSLLCVNT